MAPMSNHEPPVAPDDTPTRLRNDARVIHSSEIADDPGGFAGDYVPLEDHQQTWDVAQRLTAEVSRLQQEHATKQRDADYWRGLFNDADAYTAKLLEENALLRRSLEMLTKQMAETPTVNEDGF
jgi:hypothetical protein